MEKYLIILIILIVLYYIHKHCIQSEVENILINKKNNVYKTVQQEQALLEIQSKVKESMKEVNTLITQVKDKPEIKKKLITKNIENFTDTIEVGTDMIGPSINKGYPNNIFGYSPEIEEIIQKFRILVSIISGLPQTKQTIDAFYNLGREVIGLSETRVIINDLIALVAKVKVHLPKSLNSRSQGLTQQVIYILDRLLTQINELLVNLPTSLPINLLQTQKQTQVEIEVEAQRKYEAEPVDSVVITGTGMIHSTAIPPPNRLGAAKVQLPLPPPIPPPIPIPPPPLPLPIAPETPPQNSYNDDSEKNNYVREHFTNTPKIDYFWKGKQSQSSIYSAGISKNNMSIWSTGM
jgi:hypothetical protein